MESESMKRRAWLAAAVGMMVVAGGAGVLAQDAGAARAARPKAKAQTKAKAKMDDETKAVEEDQKLEYATFGGGCFWCVEAVFERIPGVKTAVSGYAGGTFPRPTYELVCSGETGHAEVVQIAYDPTMVTFEQLLEVFFASHDPTTLNRQGPDVGTQYRSIILAHDEGQAHAAMKFIQKLNNQNVFGAPVVTEVVALQKFFPAEKYHQDYFKKNPNKPYCQMMIVPKLKKLGLTGK
jgi:peptide-methionine (S)-S-oxide reductase